MGMCYFHEGWFSLRVNLSLSAGGQTRWQKRRWFISFWTPPLVDGSIHKRERQLGCQPRHLPHWQLSIILNIGQCALTAISWQELGEDFWEHGAEWMWSPGCVALWKVMFPSHHSDTLPNKYLRIFCARCILWDTAVNTGHLLYKSYPLEFYSLILRKNTHVFLESDMLSLDWFLLTWCFSLQGLTLSTKQSQPPPPTTFSTLIVHLAPESGKMNWLFLCLWTDRVGLGYGCGLICEYAIENKTLIGFQPWPCSIGQKNMGGHIVIREMVATSRGVSRFYQVRDLLWFVFNTSPALFRIKDT